MDLSLLFHHFQGVDFLVTCYFGLPGAGKTCFATMLAQKELKRIQNGKSCYARVLTNFACTGCFRIDYRQLGIYDYSDSLIILDEITLDADSRNFKSFTQEKKEFFLMHRHYNCDIIYCTQQWDGVDKKIRDITQELYRIKKPYFPFFNRFTIATRIWRCVEINEYTKEIVNGYRFSNWLERIAFRTVRICYRPLYYRYFDSFDAKSLRPIPYALWSDD